MKRIVIGTRASKLAMVQTQWVVERLREQWPDLEIAIEHISTTGDRMRDKPLTQIGGDGVFVKEIEHALHQKRIDLAVHSLKDLPTAQPEGLRIVAVGPREDVRDVLVVQGDRTAAGRDESGRGQAPPLPYTKQEHQPEYGRGDPCGRPGAGAAGLLQVGFLSTETSVPNGDKCPQWRQVSPMETSVVPQGSPPHPTSLRPYGHNDLLPKNLPLRGAAGGVQSLPTNPRIGTCSLRRTAQMRAFLPNAQILALRGNVDTRLRKLDAGDYDGIVLAAAGLHRLALQERLAGRITYLPVDAMMPAPGQGALALEMCDDPEIQALVAPLENTVIQATTSAERMFMRRLGAGCYLPVAAYGEFVNEMLTLRGLVISLDGQRWVRVQQSIRWAAESTTEHAGQLGIQLAEEALVQGAAEIIATLRVQEGQYV